MDNRCPHENELREAGWDPVVTVVVWEKPGEAGAKVHVHGKSTPRDLLEVIKHLLGILIDEEDDEAEPQN